MKAEQQQPGGESAMEREPEYAPRYPGSGRLRGKTVLLTGGDSGIGRAVVLLFAREGANIAFLYLNEHEDAQETIRLVEKEGSKAIAMAGDVGNKANCKKIVDKTIDAFGGVDVLICNAAEQHAVEDVVDIPEDQIERTFRTNVFGQFFMIQSALPHLKEGSSIICTLSVTAYRGQDLLIDYSSTKGAILALVRALAVNSKEVVHSH